jgi:hypothetical protein
MQPTIEPGRGCKETALIEVADKSLYSAKEHGINRVYGVANYQ